jgi:hypothetical protein
MDYRSLEHKIRDLWIAEANRNTEMRRKVANVGRLEDNVKDETSKLGKQGEIKTKIIDEAADGDVGNVVADKKKSKPKDKDDSDKSSDKAAKKDTDMDDMEAKTIKGGKTEVDTEPTTDDSTENSSDESKKAKKATNQENKKIGAKGVKEETMLKSDKNHGSSQSLIDAITEALKGKQHKIDANHNGKIDAQDFKILKGKKKVEEEVVDEGNANLIKKIEKQKPKAVEKGFDYPSQDPKSADRKTLTSFHKEIKKFNKEEVEVVEEGSEPDAKTKARNPLVYGDKKKSNPMVYRDKHRDNPMVFGKKKVKEEVEELDERDMGNKAKKDAVVAGVGAKNRDDQHLGSRGMKTSVADKIRGREKMSGVDRKQYKEEVEFSEEEIARIEEIAASIDEVVTARKLTAADKAARAKYLAGHKAKMASYAPHEIKADAKSFKDRNTETGDYSKEPSKMHKTGLLNTLTKQDTKRD